MTTIGDSAAKAVLNNKTQKFSKGIQKLKEYLMSSLLQNSSTDAQADSFWTENRIQKSLTTIPSIGRNNEFWAR